MSGVIEGMIVSGLLGALKSAGFLQGVKVVTTGLIAYKAMELHPYVRVKRKFRKAVQYGKIKHTHDASKKDYYPKIKRLYEDSTGIHVIFTLPLGMPPKTVIDNAHVFRQYFGGNIDLHELDANKMYHLAIYREPLQSYAYTVKDVPGGMHLPVYLGKSRQGIVCYDMTQSPHLLITGETGSGKSTALRSILTTMLLRGNVDLYTADLKMSEFHLFRPYARYVALDRAGYRRMIGLVNRELDARRRLLNDAQVAHIEDLQNRPPDIVVAIDEFATLDKRDLLMLLDIAQQGRALGVYLIMSTQRADANVLDGKIKLCLTVRMAFRASDAVNSRITIDSDEAAEIKPHQKGLAAVKGLWPEVRFVQVPLLTLDNARRLLEDGYSGKISTAKQAAVSAGCDQQVSRPATRSNRGNLLSGGPTVSPDNSGQRSAQETLPDQTDQGRSATSDVSILDAYDIDWS